MTKPNELLPCPFCGSSDAGVVNGGPGRKYATCHQCHATTNDGTGDLAIRLWNTRTALLPCQVSDAMIEAGAAACRKAGVFGANDDVFAAIYTAMTKASTNKDVAQVGANAAELPLSSELHRHAGADHAPGSAAREGSAALKEARRLVAVLQNCAIKTEALELLDGVITASTIPTDALSDHGHTDPMSLCNQCEANSMEPAIPTDGDAEWLRNFIARAVLNVSDIKPLQRIAERLEELRK